MSNIIKLYVKYNWAHAAQCVDQEQAKPVLDQHV